jgi:hypothetical protein
LYAGCDERYHVVERTTDSQWTTLQVIDVELERRPQKRSQKLRDSLEHVLSEGMATHFPSGLLLMNAFHLSQIARPTHRTSQVGSKGG